jgi:serine/threonine protein kinase
MLQLIAKLSNKDFEDYITQANEAIDEINRLINKYNTPKVIGKAEILAEIYQHQRWLDSIISHEMLMSDDSFRQEYIQLFHHDFLGNLKKEFSNLGLDSLNESVVNKWDINNNQANEKIPDLDRFNQMIKPKFWSLLSGCYAGSSTPKALEKVASLLMQIERSKNSENTQEHYYQLTHLKSSLREIIIRDHLSAEDEAHIKRVIASVNGRIATLLENNQEFKRKISPKELVISNEISNASEEGIRKIVTYLEDNLKFSESEFQRLSEEEFSGFKEYTISYLGGFNAKNYLLYNPKTQEQYVLKITSQLGNSRYTSDRLKATVINDDLAHVFSYRGCITDKRKGFQKIKSLEITEFCANGDVLSYGKSLSEIADKLASAADIYEQMANTLTHFEANNALFPDMKPSNFLLSEDGKLIIADTKSFIEANFGIFNVRNAQGNKYYLHTVGLEPPELITPPFESKIDNFHAYLMGVSLYLYLTDQDEPVLIGDLDDYQQLKPSFFNFEKEVFTSDRGGQFQQLITALINPDPQARLSLHQAKQFLHAIQHDIKSEHSSFKSKSEACLYAIHHLDELQKKHPDEHLDNAIRDLKILFENHEQDPAKIADVLVNLLPDMANELEKKDLSNIAQAIVTSLYDQTPQEKFENPVGRRFESQMQIELLRNPTDAMMNSVFKISYELLKILNQLDALEAERPEFTGLIEEFTQSLISGKNPTGFGAQITEIEYGDLINLLAGNNKDNLNQILFVHFMFAQNIMRTLPSNTISLSNKEMPVGKLRQIIEGYCEEDNKGNLIRFHDNPQAFFNEVNPARSALVSDKTMYFGSPLYKAELTRGRLGLLETSYKTSQMGIMLQGQPEDGLPTDPSSWTPDAKYQGADLASRYVLDLIDNDAVYVAGPSGMTSLFLNIMELYGNFRTQEEKQHYLTAVSAYMVSGGFHSLHEVIGPAQYCLDLVPGYNVTAPEPDKMAPPPNFHQFYQQQMQIDPQFQERYEQGWRKTLESYNRQQQFHVHKPIADFDAQTPLQRVVKKDMTKIYKEQVAKVKNSDEMNDADRQFENK